MKHGNRAWRKKRARVLRREIRRGRVGYDEVFTIATIDVVQEAMRQDWKAVTRAGNKVSRPSPARIRLPDEKLKIEMAQSRKDKMKWFDPRRWFR